MNFRNDLLNIDDKIKRTCLCEANIVEREHLGKLYSYTFMIRMKYSNTFIQY